VVLYVYDLSGGAARGMAQVLLGIDVEIIPHTGGVFGRGEQASPPAPH